MLRDRDVLEVERTFGPEDVEAFLRLCGDTNPIHSCPVAAGEAHGTPFQNITVAAVVRDCCKACKE